MTAEKSFRNTMRNFTQSGTRNLVLLSMYCTFIDKSNKSRDFPSF